MNLENPIGIVNFGNSLISCLIFKIKNNNEFEILSTSTKPSDGIHNDIIINLNKASDSIRVCVSDAEKKAGVSLKKINVILEQPDFLCTKLSKHKKIDGSSIERDDIEFLLKEGKKHLLLNDKNQKIIHIFNHNYIVDGKSFAEEPIGIHADSLSHEITFISAPKNNLKNINQAFINCDVEIERIISKMFALGANYLNNNELHGGTILIDSDYDKTSLSLFKNLALIYSITLPVGINNITKDISKVCLLDLKESEIITNNLDYMFKNNSNIFDDNSYLKKEYFINSSYRKISKNLILDVIKARVDEIFYKLKNYSNNPGFDLNSGIKILLVGHGSNLNNLDNYCSHTFGPNLSSIVKKNASELEGFEKNYASFIGAIKIIKDGWETEAIPEIRDSNIEKKGFFSKIFNIY